MKFLYYSKEESESSSRNPETEDSGEASRYVIPNVFITTIYLKSSSALGQVVPQVTTLSHFQKGPRKGPDPLLWVSLPLLGRVLQPAHSAMDHWLRKRRSIFEGRVPR